MTLSFHAAPCAPVLTATRRSRFAAPLSALLLGGLMALPAMAEIVFYEQENFRGRSVRTQEGIRAMGAMGFNDRASSVEVRGERWEVCEDNEFGGHCRVLRPGSYPSLASMGLNDRISSARLIGEPDQVDPIRYSPDPQPSYLRRGEESLFQAPVTSVRAVMGEESRRCWVEPQEVKGSPNVGGAVVGGVLGGILGHQIGGGSGRDIATAAGAVGGAVVGSNVNRKDVRNVQRCGDGGGGAPTYWDVRYRFNGQEHSVQTSQRPGATITVNGRGEPRL